MASCANTFPPWPMLDPQFTPFPILTTARLVLRAITVDDAAAIFRIRSDQRVMRYIGKEPTNSIEDALRLIADVQLDLEKNDAITWAITKKGVDKMIGTIGYYRLKKEHHRGELGFALDADQWRQGIMSEAIPAVVECGFDRFGFHGIEAITDRENVPTNGLLEACGFVREGLIRESYLWRGHFRDSAIWCKLAPRSAG